MAFLDSKKAKNFPRPNHGGPRGVQSQGPEAKLNPEITDSNFHPPCPPLNPNLAPHTIHTRDRHRHRGYRAAIEIKAGARPTATPAPRQGQR